MSLSPAAEEFKIEVSDPKQVGTGVGSYISYLVKTETTSASFSRPKSTVLRRFNDFVWLKEKLVESQPYAFIPNLPDTANMLTVGGVVGQFDLSAVNDRRALLQRWLRRIARHSKLRSCVELQQFLEMSDEDFNSLKANRPKKQSNWSSMLTSFLQVVPKNMSVNVVDKECEPLKNYLQGMKDQISLARDFARAIARRRQQLGDSFRLLGSTLVSLGVWEGEEGGAASILGGVAAPPLHPYVKPLGDQVCSVGGKEEEHSRHEMRLLAESMDEYMLIVGGGLAAVARRSTLLGEIGGMEQEIQRKRQNAVRGGRADEEIAQIDRRILELKSQAARAMTVLNDEMKVFSTEKGKDWAGWTHSFVRMERAHIEKLDSLWKSCAASLPPPPSVHTENQDEEAERAAAGGGGGGAAEVTF